MEKIKNIVKKTPFYSFLRKFYISYLDKTRLQNKREQRKEVMKNYGKNFYLNVGGGMFIKKDWRIMDYGEYSSEVVFPKNLIDYCINLVECKKWLIPNESIDLVYSSHCLEHLGKKAALYTFKEMYRVMKKGGVLRITVPDIDRLYQAYMNNDFEYFKSLNKYYVDESIDTMFLKLFSPIRDTATLRRDAETMTKYDFLNKYTPKDINFKNHSFGMHITYFNHEIIEKLSKDVGFSKYIISSRGQSISHEMRTPQFDTVDYKLSLYADIIK